MIAHLAKSSHILYANLSRSIDKFIKKHQELLDISGIDISYNDKYIDIHNKNFLKSVLVSYKDGAFSLEPISPLEDLQIAHNYIEVGRLHRFGKLHNDKICEQLYRSQNFIRDWKHIRIDRETFALEKEDLDFSEAYSVNVEDSFDLILQWIEKYKSLTEKYVSKQMFIPTLTGGLDTRALTYFWRDFIGKPITKYFLKINKTADARKYAEDPAAYLSKYGETIMNTAKLELAKDAVEHKLSSQVAKRLGNLEVQAKLENFQTSLSGLGTDSSQFIERMNNKEWVRQVVGTRCATERLIYPFYDDLFLRIKFHRVHEQRILFALMLCPDLLDIPLVSDRKFGQYMFSDLDLNVISYCEELLKKWNWKN